MTVYRVFGERLPQPELISGDLARLLVRLARHGRVSRVRRYGKPGQRRYVLEPRNKQEHFKRKGKLR